MVTRSADRIYLLAGKEEALKNEHLRALESRLFQDNSARRMNLHRFRAEEDPLSSLITQAQTMPFLSENQLVILEGIEDLSAADRELLVEFIGRVPAFTVLVLTSEESRVAKSGFLTQLSKGARVLSCQTPWNEGDVVRWMNKKAAALGKTLEPDAAELLAELVGSDLTAIESRIEVLAVFAGDAPRIRRQDVEKTVGESLEQNAFWIYEAIQNGRTQEALRAFQKLALGGTRPHEVLTAILWRHERVVRIKNLLDEGTPAQEVAARLGIPRFYLEEEIGRARRQDAANIAEEISILRECETRIKRGIVDPALALEWGILRLGELRRA